MGALQTGAGVVGFSTVTGSVTVVPDSAAVSTSWPAPEAAAGTVAVTVAAPALTGAVPSAVAVPAAFTKLTASDLFAGLPSDVRSSWATVKLAAVPALTVAGAPLTATPCRAKSGDRGLLAEM